MFFRKKPFSYPARLPAGERIYAIGDIHGEAALLNQLLAQIARDNRARAAANVNLIILGDFIDRGPHSEVILRSLSQTSNQRIVVLKGNHEECLLACYHGDEKAMDFWRRFGGRATMASLGVPENDIEGLDSRSLIDVLRATIDKRQIEWLHGLPVSWSMGDYYFAHAGIRPGVKLEDQKPVDLMWIRDPFLQSALHHGKVVVHGHSIEEGVPQLGGNRIGIDTGGHEHRRLTALGLDQDCQWIVQASDLPPNPGFVDEA